ncbi:MAG: UDP-N-acetylmuramate dehydrogenase [Bacteroidales bacterium]|jgi:UDP-N-acetylmuramate dehydrogenase|nr:UDP-N-acetylmuramate dehydrogenase [Bacteroidales bacterium]
MFQLKENFPLKKYNTFGFDVNARYLAICSSIDELIQALNFQKKNNLPLMILGGGSNVLLTGDFPGVIIKPDIKGVSRVNEDRGTIEIKAGAGEDWDDFVKYCVEHGWGGVENLSLIPGNVGTCPIQNIGAYGVEVKDVITEVQTLEIESSEIHHFQNKDCLFGYRDSIFKRTLKGKHIITHVSFRLKKNPDFILDYGNLKGELEKYKEVNLLNIRQAVIDIRNAKLPRPEETGNAGSFFKNPVIDAQAFKVLKQQYPEIPFYLLDNNLVKIPAGWLIEKTGWKGKKAGNVGVHKNQALVLINLGNATGNEVVQLAREIQQSVAHKFGINLEMEVNIV